MGGEIPDVELNSGLFMPTIALGTVSSPPASAESFRTAMLDAISLGYRHFDTASLYRTERKLGEAVAEAIQQGLINSREELFITSKIWPTDCHPDRVIPALQLSLRSLQLEYLDLYLIHWPVCLKPKEITFPIDVEDVILMDMKSVWEAMEECQKLGLVKSIGVSNFSCKKLEKLLSLARINPSVNQVEMNPIWQQKKLMNFCKEKGIHVVAYSPLGSNEAAWGTNQVMECEVLKEIALTRGKSVAQVSLRWIHEQGASLVIKSFRKERMRANVEVFDWELSEEELHRISLIPQCKNYRGDSLVSATGPYKSLDELWDGEI